MTAKKTLDGAVSTPNSGTTRQDGFVQRQIEMDFWQNPGFGFEQLPTPPESPRKRRNLLRESEDTEGECSIEEYLCRSDAYRSTTIINPWPYPVSARSADPVVTERVNNQKEAIIEILKDNGFPDMHPHILVDQVTKTEYPGGHIPVDVLRILYTDAKTVPKRLGPAKDALYRFLRNQAINLEIEIAFLDKCFQPSLFAVQPGEPAAGAYQIAEKDISVCLSSILGQKWRMVSLFNVGRTKDKTTPSIVVFVDPFTVANWSDAALQLRAELPTDHIVTLDIAVEFIPGKISLLADHYPTHNGVSMVDTMREDGIPVAGTSIGVPGERGGGSLGPFITLDKAGNALNGALTNYHVVCPSHAASYETKVKADRFGSQFGVLDDTNTDVNTFAVKDIEMTSVDLKRLSETAQKSLDETHGEKEMREISRTRIPQRITSIIETSKNFLKSYERKINVVNSMPMRLGKVCVSSGKSLIDNKVSDWAIIDLEDNFPPQRNAMPHVPPNVRPDKYHSDEGPVVPEGTHLDEFGTLRKGSWYCKVGRSTGFTAGICNGLSAQCQWPSTDRIRYDEKGNEVALKEGITKEYIISTETEAAAGREQDIFCKSGDSGSGIIASNGLICGLLYGAATGLCGMRPDTVCGLCTPMPDIQGWVAAKTGGTELGLP